MKQSPLPGMKPPYDGIIDARRLGAMSAASAKLILDFASSRNARLLRLVRRTILMCPRDPVMAMVANGLTHLATRVPAYTVVPDLLAALEAVRPLESKVINRAIERALETAYPNELATLETWVEQHLSEARIENAARALGSSVRTLQRWLRASGTNFKSVVMKKRREAAELGLRNDQKVAALAHDLGYASHSSFTSFFRRALGVTPKVYRRRG